jgi:hypothetical protein
MKKSSKYEEKVKKLSERELPFKAKPISPGEGGMKSAKMDVPPMKKMADMPKEPTELEKSRIQTEMIKQQGLKSWENLSEEEKLRRLNLWK